MTRRTPMPNKLKAEHSISTYALAESNLHPNISVSPQRSQTIPSMIYKIFALIRDKTAGFKVSFRSIVFFINTVKVKLLIVNPERHTIMFRASANPVTRCSGCGRFRVWLMYPRVEILMLGIKQKLFVSESFRYIL